MSFRGISPDFNDEMKKNVRKFSKKCRMFRVHAYLKFTITGKQSVVICEIIVLNYMYISGQTFQIKTVDDKLLRQALSFG